MVTGGRRVGDRYTEATPRYNYLRRRGVAELAVREMVRRRGRLDLYESIFGLDEAARVTAEEVAGRAGTSDILQSFAKSLG